MGPEKVKTIEAIKALRVQIDAVMQVAESAGTADAPESYSPKMYWSAEHQVFLKLAEAKMWAGKMLEGLGTIPYPVELADKANIAVKEGGEVTTVTPVMPIDEASAAAQG